MSPRLAQAVAIAAAGFAVLSPASAHASTWSAPVAVAPAAGGTNPSTSPAVAVDGNGSVTAVWAGDGAAGYGVYSATRAAAPAAPWSAPVNLAPGTTPRAVQVSVNAGGQAVAGWTDEAAGGNRVLNSASRSADGTWTAASSIQSGSTTEPLQQLRIDAAGRTFGLFSLGGTLDSLAAPAGGALASAGALTSKASEDLAPFEIAIDAAGAAAVVYLDETETSLYTASRPVGGSWTTPTPIEQGTAELAQPQLAMAYSGRAVAVWLSGGSTGAVRTATRTESGVWSAASDIATTGENEGVLSVDVAIDGYGRRTAVWSTVGGTLSGGIPTFVTNVQSSTALSASPWSPVAELAPRLTGTAFYTGVRVAGGTGGQTIAFAKQSTESSVDVEGAVRTRTGAWEPWTPLATDISVNEEDAAPAAAVVDHLGRGTIAWANGRSIDSRTISLSDPVVEPGPKDPDPAPQDPAPTEADDDDASSNTPEPANRTVKLVISLNVLPAGKKCPKVAAATVDGVRTNLKVKKTKLRKKLACKVTGTVVLKPTVKVGAKVKVLITAKGVKKKTVQLVATA